MVGSLRKIPKLDAYFCCCDFRLKIRLNRFFNTKCGLFEVDAATSYVNRSLSKLDISSGSPTLIYELAIWSFHHFIDMTSNPMTSVHSPTPNLIGKKY